MSVLQLDTHDLVSYIMANVIEKLETYIHVLRLLEERILMMRYEFYHDLTNQSLFCPNSVLRYLNLVMTLFIAIQRQ